MKPRLSRSLRRILAGVVVCGQFAQAEDLDWVGTSANSIWNTTEPNWAETGATEPAVTFSPGDDVTFVAAPDADVSTTVDITADVEAGQVTVDGDYTFSADEDVTVTGDIHGEGAITKTGAGSLTLNATENNADSTLGLDVAEGALVLDGTNAYGAATIGDGTDITVAETADITFNDAVTGDTLVSEGVTRFMADSGLATLDAPGTVVIGADGDAAPTVTLANESTIGTFENYGTLAALGGLTLTEATAQGGAVETPRLTLAAEGNTFTSVVTDLIQAPELAGEAALVTTESIAPQTDGEDITVHIDQVNRMAERFTIVEVTGDTSSDTTYTMDADTVAMFREAGLEIVPTMDGNGGYSISFNRVPSAYYSRMAVSPNARAGAALVEGAFLEAAPQWNRRGRGDMARVMDRMDALIANGSAAAAEEYDRLAAEVAGPGVAALGVAWRGEMERQLRAIRDRVSVMSRGIPCCPPDAKGGFAPSPTWQMWANADIDYQDQYGHGDLPGYKTHGIGGTFGVAGRIGKRWILGGAVSGMSGRISSKGYGSNASGDLDTYYASIFTRFDHGCWSHTLTGVVGFADVDFSRHVNYGDVRYDTKGTPDGLGMGIMYEVSRSFRLNSDYLTSAWWQPVLNVSYIHSRIDSYTESGSDAALSVGRQDYNNVIFGFGARMQTIVGRRFLNRDSVFNLRVLGKAITGDRHGSATVGIAGLRATSEVRTAQPSVFSVEVGGGIAIPCGDHGSIIAECTADFANKYRAVNGVVGYRIKF